ncbi:MAG: hypothetical protein VX619_08825 [bacterium]|nr:hypothetical protein [bacterium]
MIIHVNLLITLFHFLITNNLISKTYPLEHELTRIEEFCELPSKSWNGCPQNTLLGWENHDKRLQRWYQFINPDQIHLDYLSFLRYKLKNDDSDEHNTIIYLNYAPLIYARACQFRKSMSPYQRFQRLLVWVMTHKMNPIRSGSIRPYFWQILTLQSTLQRKHEELNSVCFKRLQNQQ